MWVATDNGLNHLIDDHGHVRIISYETEQGLSYNSTRCLLEDKRGDLWIGTDRGVSHIHDGVFVRDAATEAMAQMKVWAIHEDSEGGLWFGTRNNGLFRFRSGNLAHFTTQDGLASNAVYDILEDSSGHLWMSGPNGISMVNRLELDAQAGAQTREIAPTFTRSRRWLPILRFTAGPSLLVASPPRAMFGFPVTGDRSTFFLFSSRLSWRRRCVSNGSWQTGNPRDDGSNRPATGQQPSAIHVRANSVALTGWSTLPLHARGV